MNAATFLLVVGILSSSFLGSWHCAGMCSPVASLMAQRKSLLAYHLGRLLAYVGLGVVAGGLGQIFLQSEFVYLRFVSSIILALILILMGLRILFPKFFKHNIFQSINTLAHKMQIFHLSRSGLLVGMITAFLPCGWLYTYVMAAIATRSILAGALTMAIFWLGTLPALSVIPAMVRRGIQSSGIRQQRVAGAVLVCSGLYSILSFFFLH
jgi:sulfite exporter TauE/SafE